MHRVNQILASIGLSMTTFFTGGVVAVQAETAEPVVTLQSTVSGTADQPRVLYIVPWQEPGAAEFDYVLDNRLVQDVFAPIDRDEFVRELYYREKLTDGMNNAAVDRNVE